VRRTSTEDLERFRAILARQRIRQASRKGTLEPVLAIADRLPRGRALDAPSGPGAFAGALLELGFDVTAADLDAESFALHGKVGFRVVDLEERLPFEDGSFCLVHCGDGIEHLENPFALFREFARVLAPGGTLIVTTPNYLSVQRRVRFLLTGSLTRPLRRRPGWSRGPRTDRGHIGPLTLTRLAYMAENADLELREVGTLLRRARRTLLELPLALAIRLYVALRPAEDRRRLFAEHTASLAVLAGGRKLIAVFSKAAEGPGAGLRADPGRSGSSS
jgi:SAM-dependent methyltransferase